MLAETILDEAQSFLHDGGDIWTRSELLNWLNDGYRDLLTQTHALVRPFQHDIPGRVSYSGTQEWEDRHEHGLFRRFTRPVQNGRMQVCFKWEAEALQGITPTDSLQAVTQLWERAYADETEGHFRFALSKAHEKPLRAYWGDKRLNPISTKELDLRNTEWWSESGEPWYFLQGTGREQSFEVFEVVTDYNQAYFLQEADQGVPRYFSGSRSYQVTAGTDVWDYAYSDGGDGGVISGLGFRFTLTTDDTSLFTAFLWEQEVVNGETSFTDSDDAYTYPWEIEFTDNAAADSTAEEVWLGLGLTRGLSSPDRQYLCCAYDSGSQFLGSARDFHSSDSSLTLWEVVVPSRQLTELDTPDLLPTQLHKFLKFYVLGKAFTRQGEGYRPDLAQHYASLYQLGVGLLATLGTPSFVDRVYAREQASEASVPAPPRPRLPSTYPRTNY